MYSNIKNIYIKKNVSNIHINSEFTGSTMLVETALIFQNNAHNYYKEQFTHQDTENSYKSTCLSSTADILLFLKYLFIQHFHVLQNSHIARGFFNTHLQHNRRLQNRRCSVTYIFNVIF